MKLQKLKPHEVAAARQHEREIRVEIDERETLENLNREGMCDVMREFSVTIPPREFPLWKPTKRALGVVSGVYGNVSIIAHNGMIALYQRQDGTTCYGHVDWFDGKVENLFSMKRETASGAGTTQAKPTKAPRVKSKRKQILDSL